MHDNIGSKQSVSNLRKKGPFFSFKYQKFSVRVKHKIKHNQTKLFWFPFCTNTTSWGCWKHPFGIPGARPIFLKPKLHKECKNEFKTINYRRYQLMMFSKNCFRSKKIIKKVGCFVDFWIFWFWRRISACRSGPAVLTHSLCFWTCRWQFWSPIVLYFSTYLVRTVVGF